MSKLRIIMYHYVRDLANSRYPKIKGLDYELFRQQLQFLQENFNVITMEEVIEAWNSDNGKLPENAALLTFDDGYIDNFTMVFPLLKEYHMQGSFFIPGKPFTENKLLDVNKIHFILASADVDCLVGDIFNLLDEQRQERGDIPSNNELYKKYAVAEWYDDSKTIFVKRILQKGIPEETRNIISSRLFEKYVCIPENIFAKELYMNREQIKCMQADGMFIGVHGYDHYWLGNLSADKMRQDIDRALDIMDEFIDRNHWVMNYPYGSYNSDVVEYIAHNGCCLGMVTKVETADNSVHNKYLLPRLDCIAFPPKSEDYLHIE